MTDSLTEKFNISVHVDLKMEINPTLRKKKWSQNGSTLEPFWRTVPTLRVELFFSLIIMFGKKIWTGGLKNVLNMIIKEKTAPHFGSTFFSVIGSSRVNYSQYQ